jgi:hypothetical protein
MSNEIKLTGKILFDPKDVTKKHKNQASWKRVAMVLFNDDSCEYYSWFFAKRFGLTLESPIRDSHVTFINDSLRDLTNNREKTESQANEDWERVKDKWNGKSIEVYFKLDPDSNSISKEEIDRWKETGENPTLENLPPETANMHWWLIVPHDKRGGLQDIRSELGLGRPFFGMHMTIGRVVDSRSKELNDGSGLNIKEMRRYHSRYIHWLKISGRI